MQVELRMKRLVGCMVAAAMASPQGWGALDAADSTITTGILWVACLRTCSSLLDKMSFTDPSRDNNSLNNVLR
jgi:hypothetical protein